MRIIYCCIAAGAVFFFFWGGVYVWAWHSNGAYGTKYDLKAWIDFAMMIRDMVVAILVNHSVFNTEIPGLTALINLFKGGK